MTLLPVSIFPLPEPFPPDRYRFLLGDILAGEELIALKELLHNPAYSKNLIYLQSPSWPRQTVPRGSIGTMDVRASRTYIIDGGERECLEISEVEIEYQHRNTLGYLASFWKALQSFAGEQGVDTIVGRPIENKRLYQLLERLGWQPVLGMGAALYWKCEI